MIYVTKVKKTKEYKIPEMPNFEHRRARMLWLRRQKMLATISNVKSVSVQIKDIKQMVYSKNIMLVSLYSKFYVKINGNSYTDDDYITISKSSDSNKYLIYALISSDWLLDIKNVEKKSIDELRQECTDLQNKMCELEVIKKQQINNCDVHLKIKLLEYKLSSLSEFMLTKVNPDSGMSKTKQKEYC